MIFNKGYIIKGQFSTRQKIILRAQSRSIIFCLARTIFVCFFILLLSTSSYAQRDNIRESLSLSNEGIEYYHSGEFHKAKKMLERALKIDPDNFEAQGYLDLVNMELKVETDISQPEVKEEPRYKPSQPKIKEEKRPFGRYPEHKRELANIKGEYRMAFGATREDVIWKKANGDYNERNFRMRDEAFNKMNTFDARVYDRLKLVFDTNSSGEGLNFHSDITVDPWSYTGKSEKFTVNGTGGDRLELEYKYWSGTRSIINETFYTSDNGDSFSTGEFEVNDGHVGARTITSNNSNIFPLPEKDIDFIFQPVRELWFDYINDGYSLRVFPMAYEDHALTSDDPLQLSNHHIYWEPSPWLRDWAPGHFNSDSRSLDFWRGEWSDDLPFFTRDSELKRLTALRGASFQGTIFDSTEFSTTLASPKGLWQEYDSLTAVPGAIRTKTQLTEDFMLGFIDTFRVGYNNSSVDSYNNVFGVDMAGDYDSTTSFAVEVATSNSENDIKDTTYNSKKHGTAAHISIKKETPLGNAKVAYTHMDEDFDPGLANYRETRRDQFWSRHIHFKKPLDYNYWVGTSLKYEDIEPFRIGDGIDIGRKALNFRFDSKEIFDGKMDNFLDYRHVKDSEDKYVEGVLRDENTFRFDPQWTSKLLFIYHDLPKTKAGVDPIVYDTDTGEYYLNTFIQDAKDASISTYSTGLEYKPEEWISFYGIYELTNDSTFATNNFPRGILDGTSFSRESIEGKFYRKESNFLNVGYLFDLPPYNHFNIYRAGISMEPTKDLGIEIDYTKNDYKFAAGIDDNMNHFGVGMRYNFNPKLKGFLKYTFSRLYNLFRVYSTGELSYQSHHNIFLELDYSVTEYGLLTIEFGEGSVVSPVWGASSNPYGDFYPTLDTQHILRVYYQGKF